MMLDAGILVGRIPALVGRVEHRVVGRIEHPSMIVPERLRHGAVYQNKPAGVVVAERHAGQLVAAPFRLPGARATGCGFGQYSAPMVGGWGLFDPIIGLVNRASGGLGRRGLATKLGKLGLQPFDLSTKLTDHLQTLAVAGFVFGDLLGLYPAGALYLKQRCPRRL